MLLVTVQIFVVHPAFTSPHAGLSVNANFLLPSMKLELKKSKNLKNVISPVPIFVSTDLVKTYYYHCCNFLNKGLETVYIVE